MQDANEFSRKLDITAGMYHEEEQYVSDVLKMGVNASIGDPTLSGEELHKKSWSQIGADNPLTSWDWNPNSKETNEARQRSSEALSHAKDDITSIPDRITGSGDWGDGK